MSWLNLDPYGGGTMMEPNPPDLLPCPNPECRNPEPTLDWEPDHPDDAIIWWAFVNCQACGYEGPAKEWDEGGVAASFAWNAIPRQGHLSKPEES